MHGDSELSAPEPPRGSGDHALFDAAAARLLAGQAQTSGADADVVVKWLKLILRRYPTVDAEDIAQETLARVLALARQERSAPIANGPAYVTRIAQNLALDAIGQQSTQTPDTDLLERSPARGRALASSEDDEIAALLERNASHATLAAAIRLALAEREYLVVRVVTIWLDLADELGHAPTSRQVAAKAKASHTTVNKALVRFRELMMSDRIC